MHVGDSVKACPGRPCQWSALDLTSGRDPSAASLWSAYLPLPISTGTMTGTLGQGVPSSGLMTWGLCSQGGYEDRVRTLKPRRGAPIDNTKGVVLTP